MPYLIQVTRELTLKVEKLEQSDAQRQTEAAEETNKPMMLAEPQLMLTAGPTMGTYVVSSYCKFIILPAFPSHYTLNLSDHLLSAYCSFPLVILAILTTPSSDILRM